MTVFVFCMTEVAGIAMIWAMMTFTSMALKTIGIRAIANATTVATVVSVVKNITKQVTMMKVNPLAGVAIAVEIAGARRV